MTTNGSELSTSWLILYGAQLFRRFHLCCAAPRWLSELTDDVRFTAARQRTILAGLKPCSTSAVVVPSSYLSWDLPGVPYVEPAFCSAIVRGYNDEEGVAASRSATSSEKEGEEGDYRRWVWERCSPGRPYRGSLPPNLEVRCAPVFLVRFGS